MSNAEPAEPSPRRYGRILLLALGTFAIGTDNFVIAGILRPLAQGLSAGVEWAGQIVTAYALTYAIGSPLLAAATAHWRREPLVIAALAGFACAEVACALAPNMALLTAARVAAAACAALFIPNAYALAAALWPAERRGAALAKVALGTTAAMVVGVPIGTSVAHELGWRVTFLLGALVAFAAAAMLAAVRVTPAVAAEPPASWGTSFSPMARPRTVLSISSTLLWSTGTFAVYTYVSVIFGDRLGLDNVASLLFGYGLGALIGSQVAGPLIDRFGATPPIIAGVAVTAANFALMPVAGGTAAGAMIALFVLALCTWTAVLAQQSRLLAIEPEHGPVVLSLLNSAIYAGSAAGAGLGGLLLVNGSRDAPLYAASGLMAAGLVLFLLGDRIGRKASGPG